MDLKSKKNRSNIDAKKRWKKGGPKIKKNPTFERPNVEKGSSTVDQVSAEGAPGERVHRPGDPYSSKKDIERSNKTDR